MKKYLLTLSLIFAVAFANAQLIICQGNVFDTVLNRCSKTLTLPNPTLNSTSIVAVTYTMVGATNMVSPLSGFNFVGTKTFNAGGTLITYRVINNVGKVDSCQFAVVVREFIRPTIKCPVSITDYTTSTTCKKGVAIPNPIVNDNCKVAFLEWKMVGATTASSDTNGIYPLGTQFFNKGTTTITYTVRDASNNKATCTFKVTIKDSTKPIIKCPFNVTAFNSADSCNKMITLANPTYSDACGSIASVAWTMTGATAASSPLTGINLLGSKLFNLGITTVTFTVKDSSENAATCSFTVTIRDLIKPEITNCPDTIKAYIASGCLKSVTIPGLNFKDNCQTATISWGMSGATIGIGTGQIGTRAFNIGITSIADTVRDASGNYSTCKFKVVVMDTIKPKIQCLASRTDTVSNGCSKSISLPNPVFSDNCQKSVILYWKISGATVASSPLTGVNYIGTKTFNVGITNCNYYVKDAAGNITICSFKVKVVELKAPTITCPPTQQVTSSKCAEAVTVTAPVFHDNCGVTILTWSMSGATTGSSPSTGINQVGTRTFNRGTTTITYVAKDASGNYAICKQTIVLDGPVPCQNFAKEITENTLVDNGSDFKVNLFSNPTHQFFTLKVSSLSEEMVEVNVYSVNGKRIDHFRGQASQIQKFGQAYNKGSYFIEIKQGDTRKTITGIKQ